MGLHCVGLVGVLIEAKRKGLVASVRSLLDALQDVAGFWISEALYQQVLGDEDEGR